MTDSILRIPLPAGWETWTAILSGVIAATLALWVGLSYLRRSQLRAASSSDDLITSTTAPVPELDPFDVGSPDERRAGLRRKGNEVQVYLSTSEQMRAPMRGYVMDRSVGGLRLLVDEELMIGTVLRARPAQAPPGTPWIEIEVKSCVEDRGQWQMGCSYRKTPSWSVMLLFG